jgi:hypothetical protein
MRRVLVYTGIALAAFVAGCAGTASGDEDDGVYHLQVDPWDDGVQVVDFESPVYGRRCTMVVEVTGNGDANVALALDCQEGPQR